MNAALQPSSRLFGEVLEVQCSHRALQPDVQLGDVSFGNGQDAHLVEGALLIERGDMFQVAREPIQAFRQHDVDAAAAQRCNQGLIAWAENGRAGRGMIGVDLDYLPSFVIRASAAYSELILDGCIALQVGRVAGVDNGAHHGFLVDRQD